MRDRRIWQFIARGSQPRGLPLWFWREFLNSARELVRARGAAWMKWVVFREPLGVWLLLALWASLPVGVILQVVCRMLKMGVSE